MAPSDISDSELDSLSDEERAAIDGEDVGTTEEVERAAKAAESIKDDPNDPPPDAAADAAEDPPPEPEAAAIEPLVPRLDPPEIPDDAALNALLDQRKQIREQYRNGDISAEQKDELEDKINDQIADIRADRKNAEFVEHFNTRAAENDYLRTLAAVKSEIRKSDGIDYDKNPTLLQSWDIKVRTLASDPANANRPADWYLKEAHKQVMAEAAAAAEAMGYRRPGKGTQDPTVRRSLEGRRPPADLPRSLATLPAAAADSSAAGTEFAHLDGLNGDELEIAVARMTPDQQERWARA